MALLVACGQLRVGEAANPGPAWNSMDYEDDIWRDEPDDISQSLWGLQWFDDDCGVDSEGVGLVGSGDCNLSEAAGANSGGACGSTAGEGYLNGVPFVRFKTFDGFKQGYVFKMDSKGLGYYFDAKAETSSCANADVSGGGEAPMALPDYVRNHAVGSYGSCAEIVRWILPLWQLLFEPVGTPAGRRRLPRKVPRRRQRRAGRSSGISVVVPTCMAAGSSFHRDCGAWAFDTVNPNGSSGMQKFLGISSADVVMVQEARVVDGDAIVSAQRGAKRSGWGLALTSAMVTESNGTNAGAAIAARSFFGMVQRRLAEVPVRFQSRISCAHVGAFCKGGEHFISLYLWTSEGMSQRNLDLLQTVAMVVASLCGPWVLAADFNVTPDVLRQTGWLALVKGSIVASTDPTCNKNVYDYFVVDRRLGAAVLGVSLVNDAGFHPHFPSRIFLRGKLRDMKKRVLVAPKKIGARVPIGCVSDSSRLLSADMSCWLTLRWANSFVSYTVSCADNARALS